ncbi:hypothetical protein [Microcystis phage Mwe-JY25]
MFALKGLMSMAACALLALGFLAAPALASPTSVTIPYGDWAASLLMTVAAVAIPAISWALRFLPAQVQALIRTAQVEQLLGKAISYAINATAGAAKGRALSVDVGSEVAAHAVSYAIANGPGWVTTWLGGEAGIRQRIIARLEIEPAAALR